MKTFVNQLLQSQIENSNIQKLKLFFFQKKWSSHETAHIKITKIAMKALLGSLHCCQVQKKCVSVHVAKNSIVITHKTRLKIKTLKGFLFHLTKHLSQWEYKWPYLFYFVQLFLLKLKGYNWYHSITNFYFLTDNCYYSKSLSEDDVKRLKEIEAAFENFEVTRPRFYFKESKYNAAYKGYVGKAFPEVVQPLMLKLEAIFEEQNILHLLEDDPAGFMLKYDQYLGTTTSSLKSIQKEIRQLAKEHKNYQRERVEKVLIASRTDLLCAVYLSS